MAGVPSPQPAASWNEMLDAFRAMGGQVQNIVPGADGRGLFAVKPAEPVLLRVPRSLLFRVQDIELIDSELAIRKSASVPDSARHFFDRYASTFSRWRLAENTAFIVALNELPTEIRELLSNELALRLLFAGDLATCAQVQFLRNRQIPWHGEAVLAPFLELARRATEGLAYERGMHLQIQGYVRNEITLRYGAEDAYSTFCRTGVADRQLAAFSLSMNVHFGNRQITIGRSASDGVARGRDRVPVTSTDGDRLSLSYLLLGHSRTPRLPRGTARVLLREAGFDNADEVFDAILRENALRFIKLLRALEPHDGEMIANLRTMARYQLDAMRYCIGSREPASLGQTLDVPRY